MAADDSERFDENEFKARAATLTRTHNEAFERMHECLLRLGSMPEGVARNELAKTAREQGTIAQAALRARVALSDELAARAAAMGIPTRERPENMALRQQWEKASMALEQILLELSPTADA